MGDSHRNDLRPVEELATEWLRIDQDPDTRDEMYQLLVDGKKSELEKRLRSRIAFGTAGLRAAMEAGFSRMNSVTVIQASQGLAAYLLETERNVKHRGVVIGRDARNNSEKFAKLAAAAFIAKGIRVWWLQLPVHTPLVPFGVRELNAVAGIMITASHNPAKDNGYKVYWSNGCQIIPPYDTEIAASIAQNLEPENWDVDELENCLLCEGALGHVRDSYYKAVNDAAVPALQTGMELKFAYTALHGVGLPWMTRAVKDLGLESSMAVVEEQAHPDPNFPSVQFPNPEEKGALDMAIRTAEKYSCPLILATDPDADRLAVAQKLQTGKWHQFTGNQLGILLASHILSMYPKDAPREKLAMLASTVSSRMLAAMAEKEGFHFAETLTGFKWLGNVALDLESSDDTDADGDEVERVSEGVPRSAGGGYDVRFAFEEAIGYMIPSVVHDKDGIAAATFFLAAAAHWRNTENLSPYDKLQQLYSKYGYFADCNTYLISPSPSATKAVFTQIRALAPPPYQYPQTLGGRKIIAWRDLTGAGYDSQTRDNRPVLPTSNDEMLTTEVEGGVRFTARASGTEPKVKLYIEGRGGREEEARGAAENVLADLLEGWFKPGEETGLRLAGT